MECFTALPVLAALVVAIVALVGGRRQAGRLRALEAQIEVLTRVLRSLQVDSAPAARGAETPADRPRAEEPGPAAAPAATAPAPAAAAPLAAMPRPGALRAAEGAAGDLAAPPGGAAPVAAPAPPPSPPVEMPAPEEAAPSASPPNRIDWEQWLGLRGAAVVGAVVLALAGVLFLKYSIEHGLFPPAARVAAAMIAGTAAVAGSEVLRRRGYRPTADGLAGAGVVILYAACWAAHSLYGLLGALPAFGLMALVTVAAGLLAWRHRALVIASLGLAGGFAAPLLLGTHEQHPLGLFGYLLLLDVGLVALARRRGWPALAAVALGATALYELRWLAAEMNAPRVALGLLIVAGFGALFALAGSRSPAGAGTAWRLSRPGGVLLPAAFALLFAARADLGPHLWPVAAMIALLGLAAGWLDRRGEGWRLAPMVAGAAVVTVGVWALRTGYAAERAWELTAITIGLALVFRLPVEIARRSAGTAPQDAAGAADEPEAGSKAGAGGAADAAAELWAADVLAAVGLLLVLAPAPAFRAALTHLLPPLAVELESGPPAAPLAAWLAGWLALGGLLWRQAADRGRALLHYAAAAGVGLGLAFATAAGAAEPEIRRAVVAGIVVAAAFSALALLRHRRGLRVPAEGAAIAAAVLPLLALMVPVARYELSAPWTLGAALLLALVGLLAATRLPAGVGYAGVAAALFAVQASATAAYEIAGPRPAPLVPLVLLAASALLCTLWPPLAGRALADRRAAWIAAALAQPAWFLPLYFWWKQAFGLGAIALLPLAQGAAALGAAFAARRLWPPGSERRRSALAWFGAVALGFAALAVPLQLDREWITVAWALQGAAVIALWRRLDHPGLRLFGLALLAAVTVRLVANPLLLTYHEASGRFLGSWLTYTYLVPATSLLFAARWVRRPAGGSGGGGDAAGGGAGAASRNDLGRLASAGCGLAAVAVLFVWLNLAIFDAFSQPGGPVQVSIERQPARDLSMSLAWAVFALVLLGLGIARSWSGLRKLGLGFLILTLCKVFLYDLGELEDLYRVASLVGLAVSLLLVSLAYQRFVRGRERPDGPDRHETSNEAAGKTAGETEPPDGDAPPPEGPSA